MRGGGGSKSTNTHYWNWSKVGKREKAFSWPLKLFFVWFLLHLLLSCVDCNIYEYLNKSESKVKGRLGILHHGYDVSISHHLVLIDFILFLNGILPLDFFYSPHTKIEYIFTHYYIHLFFGFLKTSWKLIFFWDQQCKIISTHKITPINST